MREQSISGQPRKVDYNLIPFGKGVLPNCGDITALHLRLLPISVVSYFGPYFMRRFFYGVLPRKDFLFGAVAYVDGVPAAFGAATADPLGFLSAAMKRHWFRLGCSICVSLFQQPSRIRALMGAWRRKQGRDQACSTLRPDEVQPFGELLVGGTLAEFQRPSFIRSTGLQVNRDVLNLLVLQCAERGCASIRARVSSLNPHAILMYERLGWEKDTRGVLNQGGEIIEFVHRFGAAARANQE